MGNTESTVRRITLKKDLHDDEFLENIILTERLANAYVNPRKDDTTSVTVESPQTYTNNFRHQKLNRNENNNDFYNSDESVVEHMRYLDGVLSQISRRLDRQFVEVNQKIRIQGEKQLKELESKNKEYHISNPLKEDMERIAECLAKHPDQPLKCRNIADDFLLKSYTYAASPAPVK